MRWLRLQLGPSYPLTMHVRTTVPANLFTRCQFRSIVDNASNLIFITENNKHLTEHLVRKKIRGAEIFNIVRVPENIEANAELASDPRFKVAVLSNYDYMRGIDRLVDTACILAERGRRDVLFIIAGKMNLSPSSPGELGKIGRRGGTLADYAKENHVANMFRFLGHIADPYPVLAACDLLAKPTREYNPWGRDILEAMAFGRPVITVGTYDRFVENGVTGVLHAEFDAEEWADDIARLADDRRLGQRLGSAAAERVAKLCDGPSRAHDLLAVWQSAIAESSEERNSCAA